MKYKVGDKVRVRWDLKVGSAYRTDKYCAATLTEKMAEYRGKIVTIKKAKKGLYTIEQIVEPYLWSDEMFESVANEASDTIKPDYYQFHGYDVFDIAEHFGLSFPLGNALKYILRHKDETKRLEDLKKARQCLDRAIELMEGKENGRK